MEAEHRNILATRRKNNPDDHTGIAESSYNLALCLKKRGELKEALALLQEAREHFRPDAWQAYKLVEHVNALVAELEMR